MASSLLIEPIEGDKYYHIYKNGCVESQLFIFPNNYNFFLRKLDATLGEMIDLLAYCLLPDHFHLVFRAREVIVIKGEYVEHPVEIGHFISETLRKLFATYSANITKQEGILDPVLDSNFSRIELLDDESIRQIIKYVHFNPQLHHVADNFRSYSYSSYPILAARSRSMMDHETVYHLFHSQSEFVTEHEQINLSDIPEQYLLEDL